MLSNYEKRELARIEQSLREDARWRRLAHSLDGPLWRHRWKIRGLLGFGIVVMVCGLVTDAGPVFSEGLVIVSLVLGYWLFVRLRAIPPAPGTEKHSRH